MSEQEPIIEINGEKVPLSSINKPHHVVVGGTNKAQIDPKAFPPLEKDQK